MKAENLMMQTAPAAKGVGTKLRSAVQAKTAAQSVKADKNDFGSALDNAKNAHKDARTETKDVPAAKDTKAAPKADAKETKDVPKADVDETSGAKQPTAKDTREAKSADGNESGAAEAAEEAAEAARELPKSRKKHKPSKSVDKTQGETVEAEPETKEAATTLNAMLMSMAGEAQASAAQTEAPQAGALPDEEAPIEAIQPTAGGQTASVETPIYTAGALDSLLPQDAAKAQQAAQNQQLMDMLAGNGAEMRLTSEQLASLSSTAREVVANPMEAARQSALNEPQVSAQVQEVPTDSVEIGQQPGLDNAQLSMAAQQPVLDNAQPSTMAQEILANSTETVQQPVFDNTQSSVTAQEIPADIAEPTRQPVLDNAQLSTTAQEIPADIAEPTRQPVLDNMQPSAMAQEIPANIAKPARQPALDNAQPSTMAQEIPANIAEPTRQPVLDNAQLSTMAREIPADLAEPTRQPVLDNAQPSTMAREVPADLAEPARQPILNEPQLSPQVQTAEPVIRMGEAVLEQPETAAVLRGAAQARSDGQEIRTATRGEASESLFAGVPLSVEDVVLDRTQASARQDFGDMLGRQSQRQTQEQTNETTPETTRVSGGEDIGGPREARQNAGQPQAGTQPTNNGAGMVPQGMSFSEAMSAAPAEAAPVQQAQDPYNVVRQIVDQARLVRSDTNTEMVIRLNPEHLGELTLRVAVTASGAINATFHTENAQVRGLLESSMMQLKQELQQQGLKVNNVDVQSGLSQDFFAQSQAGQQGYPQPQHSARNRAAERRAFENDADALTVNAAAGDVAEAETTANVGGSDSVNYLV
ncbi:MAG: flagellar hook-length control protein FliK [Schwartzia sp.]|nr:flagellar hook-length control protein FliK [Schwartzia sp. (in: firmicutes)]